MPGLEFEIRLSGNTGGLAASASRRLEKLGRRRSRGLQVVDPQLARALTEVSHEIQRQIAVLVDRRGQVHQIVVGDARSIFLPDLSRYREGLDRLCGLRLVHTHMNHEPLNDDDLTDLALLRLDMVSAIEVMDDGLPGKVFSAHLLPDNENDSPWEILDPVDVHSLPEDFPSMIAALEEEFRRLRKPRAASDNRDRAILVQVSRLRRSVAQESMAELVQLAGSAGIEVLQELYQNRPVDPRFVVGKGKLKQIVIKAMQLGAETIVLDLNLSPTQVRILADFTDLKVLDRTQVILDIFAQHAQTREGKIQVELAQLRYLLPRLGAKHTAMSRLTGGIGGRGPGETKLEVNRRRAQDRIARLEREVEKLGKRRKMRRKMREKKDLPVISVVGYTNAGKSTLVNNLTNSSVIAEDALFATLNPVSRRLRFPKEREVIITDTVGFIRNLPETLMEAFRTTFEEAREADLLLHVADASSASIESQLATVSKVLSELKLNHKPIMLVLNKADLCDKETLRSLVRQYEGIAVSALNRETLTPLLEEMETLLWRKLDEY